MELFFKWIKKHFRIKHFYGLMREVVMNQVFIALSIYCLMMILKLSAYFRGELLSIQRLLKTRQYINFDEFKRRLFK
ncbi:MAG: hypothetical protein KAX49_18555 [Halanaerobiales bacterium]|nr:hypothetical protein [Halanaerobiales bacterium]